MLTNDKRLLIAKNDTTELAVLPGMLNRHGLITGATGTGKTVSLQVIAESMSALGIPVFITDIKGDVSGIAKEGSATPKIKQRVESMKLDDEGYAFQKCPVRFWDIFGEEGHPLRTTISDMGPVLISRILDLNDTQSGVLQMIFRIADEGGLLLLDFKDLRKMVEFVSENRSELSKTYGTMAPATLGAIQRGLLGLEDQGANMFFGEPALNRDDMLKVVDGKGMVNIMAADKLMQSPRIYGAFLLWLMSELYENLPEVGDLPQPKFVMFFDEAHLIFSNAPKILLERIEQVVRLIRSKGVGIFFITQNPIDIPEMVLAQLGNRVQHALRAYTPKEQKAVRAAAGAFRANPAFKTEDAISDLGVGEALVSFLDPKGIPSMVEKASMLPPESQIGPVTPEERKALIEESDVCGHYAQVIDRESAYEVLTARLEAKAQEGLELKLDAAPKGKTAAKPKEEPGLLGEIANDFMKNTKRSMMRSVSNQISRSLMRGIMGGLFGKKR